MFSYLMLFSPRLVISMFVLTTQALIFSVTPSLSYGEFHLTPRITVSEEYSDNVGESAINRRDEFTTRAQPGLLFNYKAPKQDLSLSYNFDYRHYAKGTRGDEYTHNLDTSGILSIVDNMLFVEASDTYRRVSLDVARDYTSESLYLNQSDQNIAVISPYFQLNLGGNSSIRTGYRYTNTWYREPSGIDKSEHSAYIDVNQEVLPAFTINYGYSFIDVDATDKKFIRNSTYAGFRYEYALKSYIFGQLGNTWQAFESTGTVSNIYWNAGLTHEFSVATVTVETRVQYTEDPLYSSVKETLYSCSLLKSYNRGRTVLNAGYSEFEIVDTGTIDRKRASTGISTNYELFNSLTLSLAILGERYSRRTHNDYPYRYIGNAGITYALKNDLVMTITYSYITNRYDIFDTNNSNDTNRVSLQIDKTF